MCFLPNIHHFYNWKDFVNRSKQHTNQINIDTTSLHYPTLSIVNIRSSIVFYWQRCFNNTFYKSRTCSNSVTPKTMSITILIFSDIINNLNLSGLLFCYTAYSSSQPLQLYQKLLYSHRLREAVNLNIFFFSCSKIFNTQPILNGIKSCLTVFLLSVTIPISTFDQLWCKMQSNGHCNHNFRLNSIYG